MLRKRSSSKRPRFLDPAEVDGAIARVVEAAQAEGVGLALIGGAAMQLYGSDRLTVDVDFAAESLIRALPRGPALTFGGEQSQTEGVPVDLVVRTDAYAALYEEAIAQARRMRGIPAPVASAEHLVAMKMAAARPKDEIDLMFLLGVPELKIKKARQIVAEHLGPYAADELDRLIDELAWRRQRTR